MEQPCGLQNCQGRHSLAGSKWALTILGCQSSPQGLTLARLTMVNCLERAIRLYDQDPGEEVTPARLGAYVRRPGAALGVGVFPISALFAVQGNVNP